MITLHDIARTPSLLVQKLRKLERQGRYDEALSDCLEIVDGKACVPALDGATQTERAELLLRYGALIGFLGHNSQIADSQEQSKDLLTRALGEFSHLGDLLKTAECENYIALAYWRIGELNEASVWLESAFQRDCPEISDVRLYSHLISSLINLERKRFHDNVVAAKELEERFLAFGDPFMTGSYYSNLGISYKDLGRTSEALTYLELAKHYQLISGHKLYLGVIGNNLAQLYRAVGEFGRAHTAIDSATKIFRKQKDKTREGFSLDTKAHVFLAENKPASALRTIDSAIKLLRRGENAAYLVEAIMTRAKSLLFLDRFIDAIMALVEAIEIQRIKIGDDAAKMLAGEFESVLSELIAKRESRNVEIKREKNGIELLLPAPISNYSSYVGVWINNTHLDRYGLDAGSLAVVVDGPVQRGDLIAVETEDGSIKCGLYDRDFGLICLERGDEEPELYDENKVKIVGKIVGVARHKADKEGPMVVRPVEIRN